MASSRFQLCILLILFVITTNICHGKVIQAEDHVALFVFGDSLFDAGNNNYINTSVSYRSNFWPYGETFFKYPTGRFSDGRLIPDFIAEYAKLPLIPPYKQPGDHQFIYGANFASAGAGALVQTHQGMVIDLKTQLNYFKDVERVLRQQFGDKEAKKLITRSVYLFSIANNDYLFPFFTNSSFFHSISHDPEEYVGMVIGNITAVIHEIYKEGGRKFAFFSLPPLGCIPATRALNPGNSGDCVEKLNAIVKLHNYAFSLVLQKQERLLEGFMYSNFNSYTSSSERADNPSRYGFEEVKSACCGSGPYRSVSSCGGKRGVKKYQLCDNVSAYMFFDNGHPTETANQQFAKLMWTGTHNITQPYNLKELFGLA